uniref:Uncharacterized protein n=1 Tax=Rhizophora mucronata TaxID=61149 RepID=A0A2P2PGU7_RHIMU
MDGCIYVPSVPRLTCQQVLL